MVGGGTQDTSGKKPADGVETAQLRSQTEVGSSSGVVLPAPWRPSDKPLLSASVNREKQYLTGDIVNIG